MKKHLNISSKLWKSFFPFETPRPEQEDTINFILESFFNEDKKYCICELGTGIGKSAIGVTVSRFVQYLKIQNQNNYDMGSWFLTTQKVLQEQYMKDFGIGPNKMRTIKSANNYTCQVFDYSKHPMSCAEVHRLMSAHKFFEKIYCSCKQKCRYRTERDEFLAAMDSLTNYPFFFTMTNFAQGKMNPRELLILDEAHTIEEQLGKFVEVTISEKFAKDKLKKRFPKSTDIESVVKWVKKTYLVALKSKIVELKNLLNDPSQTEVEGTVQSLTDYAKQYEILDKHACKINRFLSEFNPENWVINFVPAEGKSLRKFVFKPVDVSPFAQSHLFRMGKKVLFLSATIIDKETFCRSVGINPEEAAFYRVQSPFPVKNRPIHYMPIGSMSRAKIDQTLPKMAEAVKLILEQHSNEKGMIHCVNYRIAKYLVENVASHRLLTHDSSNRDQIVEHHCETDEPTVLLSPSMMEGVDLRDDFSRFQILCKVPFPYLGDEVIKKRMSKNPKWYDLQTVRTVVQAFGRSIRNENDYAQTYVFDSDWKRFYNRTKKMFPSEISEAIE